MLKRAAIISLLAVLATAPTGASAHEVHAVAPRVLLQQVPGVYRFQVGQIRTTALSDGTVPQDLHKLLLGTTAARTDALLTQGYLANPVEASINVYLLEMGDHRILVDAGAGDLFGPGYGGKLAESLAAAGVRPEQITDVLITHVHTDHTGGLVKTGMRVFANATVHVGKPDIDFFMDRSNAAKAHYDIKYFDEAITTLKPYLDAGKVNTFSATEEILPGITEPCIRGTRRAALSTRSIAPTSGSCSSATLSTSRPCNSQNRRPLSPTTSTRRAQHRCEPRSFLYSPAIAS